MFFIGFCGCAHLSVTRETFSVWIFSSRLVSKCLLCWLTRTLLWPAANVNVLHNAHTPTPAHSTLQHYARGIMIIYTYTQPSWKSCVLSHGEGQHGLGYFHFTILFANNQNNLQKEKLSSQPQTYLRINIITKAAIILFS